MSFQKDAEKTETKFLEKVVDFTGKRILEVGCGEGRLTWRYASVARKVTGIDPDRDSLRVAYYDMPSNLRQTASFTCANSMHIPFPRERFDIALLAWSL